MLHNEQPTQQGNFVSRPVMYNKSDVNLNVSYVRYGVHHVRTLLVSLLPGGQM